MATGRSRQPYAEVGKRSRAAIDRAQAADLSRCEHKVLLAIVSLLTTWSKTEDEIALSQLAKLAHVHPRTVRRALQHLNALGIVLYTPGGSAPSGTRRRSLVGLPPGTAICPQSDGDTGDAHDCLGDSGAPRSGEALNRGHSPVTRPETRTRPPTEKDSEETSEHEVVEVQSRTGCELASAREALREANRRKVGHPVAYAATIVLRKAQVHAESKATDVRRRERGRRGDLNRARLTAESLKLAGLSLPDALMEVRAAQGDDPALDEVVSSVYGEAARRDPGEAAGQTWP
jgi:hypothetical protein